MLSQWRNWIVVIQTTWPTKPNMFTYCLTLGRMSLQTPSLQRVMSDSCPLLWNSHFLLFYPSSFMGTFCLWLPKSFLPRSSCTSLQYIILYSFVFSIYHNLKLFVNLLAYPRKYELHELGLFFLTVSPGPTRAYAHCRHSKKCAKRTFYLPYNFFREDTVSDSFLHPPQWPILCLVWSNSSKNSYWPSKMPVTFSSSWDKVRKHLLSARPRETKTMCTVSFSPHSTVWEHILRRGHGFQHIPQRTVAMGTSSVPVKGVSNWCGS